MDKYIYLVSQLPMLHFDQKPLISVDDFLVEAEKWLDNKDYRVLQQADLYAVDHASVDPPVLKRYKANELDFRNDFVQWRKSRGTDQEYKPRFFNAGELRDGTPLDAERVLLRWKWNFLDAEEHAHHFDLEFLIVYFLKLKILSRLMTFDSDKGLENYQLLCEAEK